MYRLDGPTLDLTVTDFPTDFPADLPADLPVDLPVARTPEPMYRLDGPTVDLTDLPERYID